MKEIIVYNTQEVAEILQLHVETVKNKLRNGEIVGVNTGGGWRVTKEALEKYLRGE